MRSHIVLFALVLTLLLTAAANVVARGPGSQATAQQALPDCAVKMHRNMITVAGSISRRSASAGRRAARDAFGKPGGVSAGLATPVQAARRL